MNLDRWPGSKRFEVGRLPLDIFGVTAVGANTRREVMDALENLSRREERARHSLEVKRVVLPPAFTSKAELKVESIDVEHDPIHGHIV